MYDLVLDPFMDPLRRTISRMIESRGGRTVLDLCCGTGRQSLFLAQAGLEVIGVDRSPAMLGQARRKTPRSIRYLLEDATDLSLPDKSVDSVVMTMALHEMPLATAGAALDEALRVCRKDLLMVDYVRPSSWWERLALCLARLPERSAGRRHYAMFREFLSRGGLYGLLEEKGLAPVEARPVFSGSCRLALCALG